MGTKVTHLIANHCSGLKYRYADVFRLPIMSAEWIIALWNVRDDISIYADNEKLIATYKLKPFYGAKVCFTGFLKEEEKHMCAILEQQGGESTEINDPNCTHVIVNESNVNALSNLITVSTFIVTTSWFWTSVQDETAADEKDYLFENNEAGSLARGNLLDCTVNLDKQLNGIPETVGRTEYGDTKKSKRHQVFLELVETEANYVGILNTIMTLFKLPLENFVGKSEKELLNSTEIKIIFGNFPPIYDVHKQLLEVLRCNAANWKEDISIGKIFLNYEPDLVKAYPSYVNFFENTKQMLEECDQNKPRFHAFLKNCQTIPECGRQSLKELLIKPIQRLPSINLLLSDILKHTDKNNPDYSALEASINCIKKVMTYINEDKRKMERQLAMFNIFNEIDKCPPHLVSSHRLFINKCDVMEIHEELSKQGDQLVLFLFTDVLIICKKRCSGNMQKSLQSSKKESQRKPYKHLKLLSLCTIRKVVDIQETKEYPKQFALIVRSTQESREKLFSFIITEELNKTIYLQTLCRQMALVFRIADADTLLIRCDSFFKDRTNARSLKNTIKRVFSRRESIRNWSTHKRRIL
ncbi:protein ECT2-like isoform X2 [Anoplolepis gracilipes]